MKNTILIIEDNREVRENTVEILELNGYRVLAAQNGKTGYDLALKHKPDVIICDIVMPETNGFIFFKLVKENKETGRIPLIFFSAGSAPLEVRKGLIDGADEYLSKPFNTEELLEAIERHLKKPKE